MDADLETSLAQARTHFWPWFANHAAQLARDAANDDEGLPDSLVELERLVRGLHPGITWELGPHDSGLYFALSPGGDPRLLPLTRALAQAAPALPGWIILPAKPSKSWNRQLAFDTVTIDASHWRYVLTLDSPPLHTLSLTIPYDYGLSPPRLAVAARIVLESDLGEETLLSRIGAITVVVEERWPHGLRSRPLYELWADLHPPATDTPHAD